MFVKDILTEEQCSDLIETYKDQVAKPIRLRSTRNAKSLVIPDGFITSRIKEIAAELAGHENTDLCEDIELIQYLEGGHSCWHHDGLTRSPYPRGIPER